MERRHLQVDDRKRKTTEEEFRQIVDNIPDLVYTMTPACKLEFVNQQALDYFGKSVEELKDWDKVGVVHPEDLPIVYASLRRTVEFGEPHEVQQRLRRYDGVYRWFQPRAKALRDSAGGLVRWYATLNDIDDLKRAEEAIRTRQADFQEIVDSIPGFVAIFKADGEVEFLSQPILDYHGWTIEQAKNCGPLVHPEDLPRVLGSWRYAIETGTQWDSDHRLRRRDGEYRWFQHRGVPRRDDGGRVLRWYVLLTDITERKAIEDRFRESEAFLLEAQRISRTGSWKHDLASGSVTITPEVEQIFGVTPQEDASVAGFFFGRIHPDDVQQEAANYARALRARQEFESTYRIVLPDGSVKQIRNLGHPKLNADGEVTAFVGTAMDVTEQWHAKTRLEEALEEIRRLTDRLRAENAALRERERDLNLIIESIPGLVWCASPDGALTYVNRRVLDYTGVGLEALAQSGWVSFLHPDDVQPTLRSWEHAITTGEPQDVQYRLRRFDGIFRWFHVVGQPAWTQDGRVSRWYGLLIDIDERKNVEESLRGAQEKLSHAAQIAAVGELSASIAHEVNQPLAAVVANGHACLRWLTAEPPNLEKAREAAGRILRDGQEAGAVVRRVRALFKRATLQRSALDLNHVILDVVQLISRQASRRGVALEIDLAQDLPSVVGDPVQLQQVVVNLLLNGIEAMDAIGDLPKTLRVSSALDGSGHVLVAIEDCGIGLTDPAKVFEAFFTTKENGMGMGLAICRSIIEAHEGRIWAVPRTTAGSRFCFTIPVHP